MAIIKENNGFKKWLMDEYSSTLSEMGEENQRLVIAEWEELNHVVTKGLTASAGDQWVDKAIKELGGYWN